MPGRTENMVRSRIIIIKKAMEVEGTTDVSSLTTLAARSRNRVSKPAPLGLHVEEMINRLTQNAIASQVKLAMDLNSQSSEAAAAVRVNTVEDVYDEVVNPVVGSARDDNNRPASAAEIMNANAQLLMQQYAYLPNMSNLPSHYLVMPTACPPQRFAPSNLTPPQMYASLPMYSAAYPYAGNSNMDQHLPLASQAYFNAMMMPSMSMDMNQITAFYPMGSMSTALPQGRQRMYYSELFRSHASEADARHEHQLATANPQVKQQRLE
jgi:hypothetical protein